MKRLLLILIIVQSLVSCKKEIEYNGPEADPALYVEALFDNDTLNYVFVGETIFFLKETNKNCLKDAEVTISVNGGTPVTLEYDADTALFRCSLHLMTGDTLLMTVNHERLGSAVAMTVVPPAVDVAVKEIHTGEGENEYDGYAIMEFCTADCRQTDGYYFTFEPYISAELFCEVYDMEHYDTATHNYRKEWQTIEYICVFSSEFKSLAAYESVEEDIDIWNLILIGDDFTPYRFEMKENNVECNVEVSMSNWMMEYADSVRNVVFYALMNVCSKDYVDFRQQRDKAKSESNNPFVEPTQVKGNIMPTGNTRYAFGCFSVFRKLRSPDYLK